MTDETAVQPDLSLDELQFLMTLWETRSLTSAASRHRMSMGSASRRLAHLRTVFSDELSCVRASSCSRQAACARSIRA